MMSIESQPSSFYSFRRGVSREGRIISLFIGVFGLILCIIGVLAAFGFIDIGMLTAPCGFRQRYGLPCPGCGMTTAAMEFFRGRVLRAFIIQPAGAIICGSIVAVTVFALLRGVLGLNSCFVDYLISRFKVGYFLIIIAIILLGGWAVTLARSLAEK